MPRWLMKIVDCDPAEATKNRAAVYVVDRETVSTDREKGPFLGYVAGASSDKERQLLIECPGTVLVEAAQYCDGGFSSMELFAASKLAVAAPELLAALKACVSEIECTPQCARGAAENARALIARLEGL